MSLEYQSGLQSSMRSDMYKVIVERPRSGKRTRPAALRLRNDLDGPMRLGMRACNDYLDLNENLQPLRRYLRAQLGRPWDKVYSEICARIDRRNTVQQHIHQHIDDFIAIKVTENDGNWSQPGVEIRESFGTRSCTWILGRESFGNISEAEEGGAPRNGEGNARRKLRLGAELSASGHCCYELAGSGIA